MTGYVDRRLYAGASSPPAPFARLPDRQTILLLTGPKQGFSFTGAGRPRPPPGPFDGWGFEWRPSQEKLPVCYCRSTIASMTNILTNLIAELIILVTVKTNPPIYYLTQDAPPCEICRQVHHEIQKLDSPVVEQRWLTGSLDGEPIKLLMSEKLLRTVTSTNVIGKRWPGLYNQTIPLGDIVITNEIPHVTPWNIKPFLN